MNEKITKYALIVVLLFSFFIVSCSNDIKIENSVLCEQNNGTWIDEVNECEYISEELCSDLEGTFNECGSACRNTNAEICTMECIPYCSFNNEEVIENTLEEDSNQTAQIANPASVNCDKNNGNLEIKESAEGQYGLCIFEDGSMCEEWSFFRGECTKGQYFTDITNCKVYFDGCNNCIVGNNSMMACTKMFCSEEDLKEPKCLEYN